ncbi:carbohydrate ABC transporter permease [Anaerocolumna xylanovorans]|uniref:Alpha-1,4-digalacturonate transport system permease protein n=1 Tax=Anaerocolumna xylanovorans DSM 12503 TaxID=1121345 RepID=A0A1M7YNJ3_9FIRM|nr:carbohydrate ABC transporter permease [Anaerocolumna xylanovorans]SHO54234.1 alpha-1,4-digalacturonate transport system permease protein [Anaerocolumna xylanovorans DSM 12503]
MKDSAVLQEYVKKKHPVVMAAQYLFIGIVTLLVLFPFYWMFVTAVKPVSEIFTYPPTLWPSEFHFNNFIAAIKETNFLILFKNSFIVTFSATVITVFINLLAGYAFAKFQFKGKEVCFFIVLSTLMIPIQVTMIPNYMIISRLHLLNNYWGLILPPCAEAFGLFLSRQFMSELPNELIESARIDGTTEFGIFRHIILPNSKSLLSVLIIFTVMWRWNDFQWPLIVLSDSKMYTVQIGLAMLNGSQYINWNMLMGASLIAILPVLIVFFIFQKQFVQGIASTGIKG